MSMHEEQVRPYQEVLSKLPFVVSMPLLDESASFLELETPTGRHVLAVELIASHLSYENVDRILKEGEALERPWIIAAPYVGGPMAKYLRERSVNYVDREGNCHLQLGNQHVAIIEGRTQSVRPPAAKGLRTPAYRALFAYLADDGLANASLREVAKQGGVSRQAVLNIRQRLVDEGILFKVGRGYQWDPSRRNEALDRWLQGYKDMVRPSLFEGSYHTPHSATAELESDLSFLLGSSDEWRFGGCAAGNRLSPYYRSPITVIHRAGGLEKSLLRRLKALPEAQGNLVVLDTLGPIGMQGASGDTVHPLLVYSEMLLSGERAREAAHRIFELFLERK